MSCCAGCQQGIGCGGLGNTDPYVQMGSVVSWTGRILKRPNGGWTDAVDVRDPYVQPRLEQALMAAGFLGVDIDSRWFLDRENYIAVVTGYDYGALNHVAQVIEGAIYSLGYYPVRGRYELVVAPSKSSQIVQPGQQEGGAALPDKPLSLPSISLPNLPDIFGGSTGSSNSGNPIDRLASWLGIGQTEAALIGGLAVLAGIVVVKKLL